MTVSLGIHLEKFADVVAAACSGGTNVAVKVLRDEAELIAGIAEFDALVLQNATFTARIAGALPPRVRWIQAASTGIDAFDRHGLPDWISLTNAGDLWAATVAEHAMALLLALVRRLPRFERHRRDRIWERQAMAGVMGSVSGRTMLIVGLGAIGRQIAKRAKAFDMRVVGISRQARSIRDGDYVDELDVAEKLSERLAEADVVVLAVPLTKQTYHLIDAGKLAVMKPTAILVNVARGGVVDEQALDEALQAGRFDGVALDVTESEPLSQDSPLWRHERIILSPHVAGFDDGPAIQRLASLCRVNLDCFQTGQPLKNLVRPAKAVCHA